MSEPIDRTNSGLREALFERLEALRDGKIDPKQAVAFATLAQTIIQSAALQLTHEKLKNDDKAPAVLGEMRLVPYVKAAK